MVTNYLKQHNDKPKQTLDYSIEQNPNTMKKIKVKSLALTQHLLERKKQESKSLKPMPRKPVTGVKFYQKDVSTLQYLDRKKLDLKRNS